MNTKSRCNNHQIWTIIPNLVFHINRFLYFLGPLSSLVKFSTQSVPKQFHTKTSTHNQNQRSVTMRPYCLLAILAVFLPLVAAAAAAAAAADRRGALVGGWQPIKALNDPHVKEIAEFAVSEYNKKSGKKLVLQRVVKGETQVVAGENYRLVIAVKDNSLTANYEGVVYERIWEHTRELLSFKQVE